MSKKAAIKTNLNIEPTISKTEFNVQTSESKLPLLFESKNYRLMILGLAIIFLGYILMMGANNTTESIDAVFPKDAVYSFRRIVLAPLVIVIGFLIEIYSILSIKKSS